MKASLVSTSLVAAIVAAKSRSGRTGTDVPQSKRQANYRVAGVCIVTRRS